MKGGSETHYVDRSYLQARLLGTSAVQAADRAASAWPAVLLLLLWAWSWIPQMIDLVMLGRQNLGFGEVAQRSSEAELAYRVIIYAIVGLSICLVFRGLALGARVRPVGAILVLAPWALLNVTYLFSGGRNNEILFFPLVVVAFAFSYATPEALYRLVVRLTVLTAVSSIALGVIAPHYFLSDPQASAGNEKAILGSLLLNGLMPTSNQLGVTLALGLPVVLVRLTGRMRVVACLPILGAMVWASSRTALAATLVLVLVMFVFRRGGAARCRGLRLAISVSGALVLLVPLLSRDPNSYSRRVTIWQSGFTELDSTGWLVGAGSMVFRQVNALTMRVGATPSTGHNVMVTTVVVGGLVGAASLWILWRTYSRAAIRLVDSDAVPAYFVLLLTMVAVLEDPIRAFSIAPSSFVLVPLLVVPISMSRTRTEGRSFRDREAAR